MQLSAVNFLVFVSQFSDNINAQNILFMLFILSNCLTSYLQNLESLLQQKNIITRELFANIAIKCLDKGFC